MSWQVAAWCLYLYFEVIQHLSMKRGPGIAGGEDAGKVLVELGKGLKGLA